jgi:hypothetical protein
VGQLPVTRFSFSFLVFGGFRDGFNFSGFQMSILEWALEDCDASILGVSCQYPD